MFHFCAACPPGRQHRCAAQGCHRTLALACAEARLAEAYTQPTPSELGSLDLQVRRLDVESGDILVVRTAKTLTREQADLAHDTVAKLAARHGIRDVSVLVLDACTDLTVQRP